MTKVEIILKAGKWLINGKSYQELTWPEKSFFDEFLMAMRTETEPSEIRKIQDENLSNITSALEQKSFNP